MSARDKLEMHIEEAVDLIHEVLLDSSISEELRLKLLAWRSKADTLLDAE